MSDEIKYPQGPAVQEQLRLIQAQLESITEMVLQDSPKVGERFLVGSYEKHDLYATIVNIRGTLYVRYDVALKLPVEYIMINLEKVGAANAVQAEADGQAG